MAMLLDRRYNPFNELENWNRAFFGDTSLAEFKTDIRDAGDSFLLEADLPGFKKEDINLSLNGDALTIKAVRHSDYEDTNKKGAYIRCERSYGSYARSFDVSGVDTTGIRAAYHDGVLTVTLPKRSAPKPQSHTIVFDVVPG